MTPLQTQILDIIGERLKNITIANGYFTDIIKVERARIEPFRNIDMPSANYYYTNTSKSVGFYNGVSEQNLNVIVEYYKLTRDSPFIDIAAQLSADLLIALNRDVTAPLVSDPVSPRLGQKVLRIEVESDTAMLGNDTTPYCGAVLNLSVYFNYDINDPFNLGV